MTTLKRLAALESKLIPQPDTYKPVDMRPVIAGLQVAIVGWHYGKRRKGEFDLTRFARAMKVTPEKLWRLAYADQARFRKRYLPLAPSRGDEHADDVADEIVREVLC